MHGPKEKEGMHGLMSSCDGLILSQKMVYLVTNWSIVDQFLKT